jgi:hypothetical protein|tara:strand:- start:1083 stop:1514 length:432 start_codon:yes stop_codon:yes gene_type:complete
MQYFSDASYDSDTGEDENEQEPIYSQREMDYMEIEKLLECRGPPLVIEYCNKIGVVALRWAVLNPNRTKPESVLDPLAVHSWNSFWKKQPIYKESLFDREDWNAIGEFALTLCVACGFSNPSQFHVQNVMLQLLGFVNFKYPK